MQLKNTEKPAYICFPAALIVNDMIKTPWYGHLAYRGLYLPCIVATATLHELT